MDILLAVATLLAPPPLPAAPKSAADLAEHLQAVVKESRPAAAQALATFEELVTDDNFRSLGFESKDEAKAAEPGVPFPVVLVRLDELKQFKPGDDPLRLLHPLHRAVYPLTVKGQVRSGVAVHAKDGKWEAGTFGLADEVRRYAEVRKAHAGDDPKATYFLLRVPALNEYYLGHQTDKGLRLLRVRHGADQDKERLEAQPAADALLKLVPFAKEHDGKDR